MSLFGLLLLLLGLAALSWGLVSIVRRSAAGRPPPKPVEARGSAGDETQPYQPPPPRGAAENWTGKAKEIVAIIGGIVSILVGILSIIERFSG